VKAKHKKGELDTHRSELGISRTGWRDTERNVKEGQRRR
jgi:hypothetical protein